MKNKYYNHKICIVVQQLNHINIINIVSVEWTPQVQG